MAMQQLSPAPALNRDKLMTVQRIRSSGVVDSGGHVDESQDSSWETFTRQWSSLVPRGSREFFRGEQVAADITHQVEMLFNSDSNLITTKHRLIYGSRRFNIAEPPRNVDEQNHSLRFAVVEVKESI